MAPPRLLWLALALAACSPSEESAREQAEQALARGERGAAIAAIEQLRNASAETPEAYLEQATLWVRAGEAPRAVWLLDAGVARFPARNDLRLLQANTLLLVGDPARADAIAKAIPESANEHPDALLVRARAQVALGDLAAGLATFEAAEAERPDRAELRIPRVAALLEERRFVEARAALDEAYGAFEDAAPRALLRQVELVLFEFQASDALRRAAEAEQAGDTVARDQARNEVEEAIVGVRGIAGRAPDDAAAWHALASLAIAGGMPDLADPALRAAQADNAERLGLYPLLASIAIAKGDEAEAERQLRALLERSDAPAARAALANYLTGRGRAEEAIALMAAGLEAHPEDEVLRFSHAELLLQAEQLDAAGQAIEKISSSPANEPVLELLRARLLLARGDAAGARERLEQLAPRLDTSATQYWLARALEASGDEAGAAHRDRLAAVRDPAAPGPWLALLRLAQQRGDWREARQAAAAVLQRAPNLVAGWQGLVAAQLEEGQKDAALATAERAVTQLPESYEARVLKAQAQRAIGQTEEALATLKEAQAKFGEQREIAAERVLVLGFAGRFLEARAEATRAAALLGDFASLHYALAAASFQDGKGELGDAEVHRALELDPNDARPLGLRCQFEAARGRWQDALESCGQHAQKHPEHQPTLFALGVAHAALGQLDEAEKNYRRAAEIDPRAVGPRNNLAVLLAERGDLDGAIAAAQEAYALAGEHAAVIDTLGNLYLKKGLTDRAISLLEDAHARAPEMPDAQLHLAQAYRAAGRSEEAEKLLAELRTRRTLPPELRAELDATSRTR